MPSNKSTIYVVEVGVLLPKDHHDYAAYAVAFDKKHAFYNENTAMFRSVKGAKVHAYRRAMEWALRYLKNGVENTYAIIKKLVYDEIAVYGEPSAQYLDDLQSIDEQGIFEGYVDVFGDELYNTKGVKFAVVKGADGKLDFDELDFAK